MYQNPALNAPPGPDGLPMPVDPRESQEHFEVRSCVSQYVVFMLARTDAFHLAHMGFSYSGLQIITALTCKSVPAAFDDHHRMPSMLFSLHAGISDVAHTSNHCRLAP